MVSPSANPSAVASFKIFGISQLPVLFFQRVSELRQCIEQDGLERRAHVPRVSKCFPTETVSFATTHTAA